MTRQPPAPASWASRLVVEQRARARAEAAAASAEADAATALQEAVASQGEAWLAAIEEACRRAADDFHGGAGIAVYVHRASSGVSARAAGVVPTSVLLTLDPEPAPSLHVRLETPRRRAEHHLPLAIDREHLVALAGGAALDPPAIARHALEQHLHAVKGRTGG